MKEIGQRGGHPSCPPLDPPIAYHRAQISDHNSLSDRIPIHIALALAISNIGGLNTLPYIAMPHFRWIKYIAMLCYAPFQVLTDQNTVESIAIAAHQCEHDLMVRPLRYISLWISFRMISCPSSVFRRYRSLISFLYSTDLHGSTIEAPNDRDRCGVCGSRHTHLSLCTEPMSVSDWETYVSQPPSSLLTVSSRTQYFTLHFSIDKNQSILQYSLFDNWVFIFWSIFGILVSPKSTWFTVKVTSYRLVGWQHFPLSGKIEVMWMTIFLR